MTERTGLSNKMESNRYVKLSGRINWEMKIGLRRLREVEGA